MDRSLALIEMLVAVKDNIDAILYEERFECRLALGTSRARNVPFNLLAELSIS
jgi:hypothetical protein